MKTSENRIRKQLSKVWLIALCVIMITVLTSCRQTSPEPTPAIESPPPAPSPTPPLDLEMPEERLPEQELELPETIETVIVIEGMEEPMVLNLFHEPGFPFYTYYPEDMIANAAASEEGDRVIIATDFGVINPAAYIAVTVYNEGQFDSEDAFLDAIGGNDGILSEREYEWVEKEAEVDRTFDWTIREYFFMSDEFTGAIYAGEHEGQYFFFDIHYPWEYGDGMVPRVNLIMEHFTWVESGETLLD
jgi:hypothetical protein